jgi:spore maturation protein CgeB
MRIFCAVRHSKDPRYYYGGLWSGNFYPALRQLGNEIVESKTDLLPASRFMHIGSGFTPAELEMRARITEQILDEVRAAHRNQSLDLFLSYFYNSHFDPSGFDELRRLEIASINFYCNSTYQFQLVRDISVNADFSWHTERDADQLYLEVGARPVWVQMGADPNVYHPIDGVTRKPVACFIGQRYADRDRKLAALVEAHVPVAIYGAGWGGDPSPSIAENVGSSTGSYLGRTQYPASSLASHTQAFCENIERDGFLGGLLRSWKQLRYRSTTQRLLPRLSAFSKGRADSIPETLAQYEICLNFSNVWADGRPGAPLISHVRLRDFEAPMCRSCYLTGHTEEIEEFYIVGKEIDTYRSRAELIDKSRFYLAHPEAAEKLRAAGHERALRDHTWKRRFEELFRKIG